MRVLHVFSRSVLDPQQRFLGTTKDARGHTQYFLERGIEVEEAPLEARSEASFERALAAVEGGKFDAALIEGTYYPRSVRRLKRRLPRLKVLVRGVNAELLHWLDSARASARFDTLRRTLFDLQGAARFGLADTFSARAADFVLSISAWESRRYWRRLAPEERIATVPYFLPDSYAREIPPPGAREPRCVCMMTTKADRAFHTDAALSFHRLVNALDGALPGWKFTVTGDFRREKLPPCPRVEVAGLLESPLELLAASRAVALLSDYGHGFKTKLLEAICCGCRVLVTKGLFARLPPPVQRCAVVVDVRSVESFQTALAQSLEPLPPGDPNRELREEAYAGLDRALGIGEPV